MQNYKKMIRVDSSTEHNTLLPVEFSISKNSNFPIALHILLRLLQRGHHTMNSNSSRFDASSKIIY